jgi:tape measure domain-containing protein
MPKVTINITAQDDASSILRKVSTSIDGVGKSTKNTSSDLATLGKFFVGGVIAAGIYKIGEASLKASAEMEQNRVAFTTMLGSAEKANAILRDMTGFAASTPFELPQIVNAGKQMLAFGFTAKEIIPTLTKLGDVSAGLSIPLNELTAIYGKIKTSNRIMGDDLLQLGGRGIPIVEELAKSFNVSKESISKMASEGKIKFSDLENVMSNLTGEGSKFGGLMDAQSKTLGGKWSNFNDALGKTAVILGDTTSGAAGEFVSLMTNLLNKMNDVGSEGPKQLGFFETLFKGTNMMIDGTNDRLNDVIKKIPSMKRLEIGIGFEQARESAEGISGNFDNILKKGDEVASAALLYSDYMAGNVSLTDKQVQSLEKVIKSGSQIEYSANQYSLYLKNQVNLTAEQIKQYKEMYDAMNAANSEAVKYGDSDIDRMRKKRDEEAKALKEKPKEDAGANKEWANKVKEADKYYKELVFKRDMARASEEESITLTSKKEMEELDSRKSYMKKHYADAKAILNENESDERNKLRIKKTADMFEQMSNIESNFYTNSASAQANAIGEMSQALVSNFKSTASEVSKVLKDVADNSKKTGMTMGQGFQLGATIAIGALSAITAVMNMQQQLEQAAYQRKIDDLNKRKEKEAEALEESYKALEENTANVDELRMLELQAYADSLQGKTDSEIDYLLKKKEMEIKGNNLSKEEEKKKAEEKKKIDQKYAMAEWKLQVSAFKSKQEYDIGSVAMATAIGVTQAWASAMALPWPISIAVGGTLSALMVGTAAKQIGLISEQKPPAPPQFAGGVRNFEGGWAVVGERGPELANLPKNTNVFSNGESMGMLGGGGATYIINEIYLDSVMVSRNIVDARKAASYGGY